LDGPWHKETEQQAEKKQKVEKKAPFNTEFVALYILDYMYRCKEEAPLLGDLKMTRDNMKEALKYIVDNYDKLEEKLTLPFVPRQEK
jgi:hypothetical protein